MVFRYNGGHDAHYSVDSLEAITAQTVLMDETGSARMFSNEVSNYKTVSSSILLGMNKNEDDLNFKQFLISEIIDWFLYDIVIGIEENDFTTNMRVFPNPFCEKITIEVDLIEPSAVQLDILDINGKNIYSLTSDKKNQNKHLLSWNGITYDGKLVDNGVYIYTISTEKYRKSGKIIFMK